MCRGKQELAQFSNCLGLSMPVRKKIYNIYIYMYTYSSERQIISNNWWKKQHQNTGVLDDSRVSLSFQEKKKAPSPIDCITNIFIQKLKMRRIFGVLLLATKHLFEFECLHNVMLEGLGLSRQRG